jgi:hypothetical protein
MGKLCSVLNIISDVDRHLFQCSATDKLLRSVGTVDDMTTFVMFMQEHILN